MKLFKYCSRIIKINYILYKYNLQEIFYSKKSFNVTKIIGYFFKPFNYSVRKLPLGQRIRRACEDLGPIFIKFGQLLSTRADLLPEEVALELAKLQDQVPGFCGNKAQEMVSTELGLPIEQLFAEFTITPLASASIAQVHAAKLHSGEEVVVKILRPNIWQQVNLDVQLLLFFAKIADKCWHKARRFKPYAIAKEIQKTLFDELDLVREAANASQLRRNFTDSPLLYVPKIYWTHTCANLVTMERLYGTPISQVRAVEANANLKLLAERGVEIFFTQVFRDCFFHADMHPGNIWVDLSDPSVPKYMGLDFGIMGSITPRDQHYLAENFLAFFNRDYRKIAELHIESGWVKRDTRIDEFESAIRCVCEPIFQKPLNEISFGKTLLRLFQVAYKFEMQVQPQLVLLQKTLVSVEGLGRELYPDLDLWYTAKPFLENWMRKRMGSNAFLRKIRYHAPYWLEKLPDLPELVYGALQMQRQNQGLVVNANNSVVSATRLPVWYYYVLGVMSSLIVLLWFRI